MVNSVAFEDVSFDENNRLYYYDDSLLVSKEPGLHNKNLRDYYHFSQEIEPSGVFRNIHFEICDDSSVWYASFQLSCHVSAETDFLQCGADFLQCDDKLIIYPAKNFWLYVYCLRTRKCLDVYSTHNCILNDMDLLETGGVWKLIKSNNYLVIDNFETVALFDINGLKWKQNSFSGSCEEALQYLSNQGAPWYS